MSAYSNLRFEPTPEDRLLRQVIAACAKHGAPCGSPDDLRGFLRALDSNKHLAMDFWSMVARMSERGAVEDPDWLLNIIVEGVTGQTLEHLTAQATHQQPIQRLRSLLAGEDIRLPAPDPDTTARKPVRAVYSAAPAPTSPSPYLAGRRLSLEPDPPVVSSPAPPPDREPTQGELNWIIPLESYSESNRNSRLSGKLVLGAIGIVVLLACVAFLFRYHERLGNSIHAAVSSAVDTWHTSQSSSPPASTSKPTTGPPSPQLQATGNFPRNIAEPSQPPAPSPASVRDTQTEPRGRPVSNHATSDQPGDSDNPMPATGGGRVVVPEILMRQNLISSPTPTSGHDHGKVVMQAIVTKHGSVSHIHVVSGDSALRQTAVNAALARRYQPYLLNGAPIDVATTLTLDF